jgi:hypothetical protein
MSVGQEKLYCICLRNMIICIHFSSFSPYYTSTTTVSKDVLTQLASNQFLFANTTAIGDHFDNVHLFLELDAASFLQLNNDG